MYCLACNQKFFRRFEKEALVYFCHNVDCDRNQAPGSYYVPFVSYVGTRKGKFRYRLPVKIDNEWYGIIGWTDVSNKTDTYRNGTSFNWHEKHSSGCVTSHLAFATLPYIELPEEHAYDEWATNLKRTLQCCLLLK